MIKANRHRADDASAIALNKEIFTRSSAIAITFACSEPANLTDVLKHFKNDLSQVRSLAREIHSKIIKEIKTSSLSKDTAIKFADIFNSFSKDLPSNNSVLRRQLVAYARAIYSLVEVPWKKNLTQDLDDKSKDRAEYASMLKSKGNLSAAEIKQLVRYDFDTGCKDVREQFHRYYLIVKRNSPEAARSFKQEVGAIGKDSSLSHDDIVRLRGVFNKYVSGSILIHQISTDSNESLPSAKELHSTSSSEASLREKHEKITSFTKAYENPPIVLKITNPTEALAFIKKNTGIDDWVLVGERLSLDLPPKSVSFSAVQSLAKIIDFQFACLTDVNVSMANFEFNPLSSKENVLADVLKLADYKPGPGYSRSRIGLASTLDFTGDMESGATFGGEGHYACSIDISLRLLSDPHFMQVLLSSNAVYEALVPIKAVLPALEFVRKRDLSTLSTSDNIQERRDAAYNLRSSFFNPALPSAEILMQLAFLLSTEQDTSVKIGIASALSSVKNLPSRVATPVVSAFEKQLGIAIDNGDKSGLALSFIQGLGSIGGMAETSLPTLRKLLRSEFDCKAYSTDVAMQKAHQKEIIKAAIDAIASIGINQPGLSEELKNAANASTYVASSVTRALEKLPKIPAPSFAGIDTNAIYISSLVEIAQDNTGASLRALPAIIEHGIKDHSNISDSTGASIPDFILKLEDMNLKGPRFYAAFVVAGELAESAGATVTDAVIVSELFRRVLNRDPDLVSQVNQRAGDGTPQTTAVTSGWSSRL